MIVPETIEAKIQALLIKTEGMPPDEAKTEFKTTLTAIIVDAIKSATITIQPGIIQVVGSPAAQANVIPILVENSIT